MNPMNKLLFVFLFLPLFAFAKEQPVPSTIKKVTVFIDGGQIMRTAATNLPQGKTELVVSGLTKYLDPKSIRVKGIGKFTVLAIRNRLDFLDKGVDDGSDLRKQIIDFTHQIKRLQLEKRALTEKYNFLKENKKVTGTNSPVSFSDYAQYAKHYSDEISDVLTKQYDLELAIADLVEKQSDLVKKINEEVGKEKKGSYSIRIIVQADQATSAKFEISYYVSNCGWYPTYDIRIDDLKEPISLSYKANVRQSTDVDWKDVLLTFSNAMPTGAGDVPELVPFYLGEYRAPRSQRKNNRASKVSGTVFDSDGEPLAFASIIVDGATIGTTTDFDGHYSLIVPAGNQVLVASYTGYVTQAIPVTSTHLDFRLNEGIHIEEVVVMAVGASSDEGVEPQQGLLNGLVGRATGKSEKKRKQEYSKPVQMEANTNTTSIEFDVKVPYTILSKPKSQVIEIRNFEMPAQYVYQIIPKVEEAAYLVAYVPGWEQYHLLDGESNLYFENTYVGKALIDATSTSDTLALSLGLDKSISVTRTNVKDYSNKRILGSKKVIKKAWKTTIKNNKSVPIDIMVLDQIPVSRKKKIEVEDVHYGQAQFDKVTGIVKWKTKLSPYSKEEFGVKYTVKYPKDWSVNVE